MTRYKKKAASQQPTIIVNDITQVSPDRNRKDIGHLKNAIQRAESIYVPNRTRLYDLYHDIVTLDGHLSGLIEKRTNAVLNKKLQFFDKDKQHVTEMDALISSARFRDFVELVMNSKFYGISGAEFIVGSVFDFVEIPRKHIRPEAQEITKSQYDCHGTPYADMPFVYVVGKPDDLGKLLRCSMYALYKRSGFGDFSQYVEIFGQPVRIIYYDAYDTRTKEQLKQILNESGSSLAMMIPQQAKFEMMDGKTSNGNGDLHLALIRACNEEMSIAILGNTETTSSSSSSGYAQAEIHQDQQMEITKSDMKDVLSYLNSDKFLGILASYGYPVEGGSFTFEKETDFSQLAARLSIDMQVSAKVPISDEYWYDTYGIPMPDNYDELKKKQEERADAAYKALQKASEETDPDEKKRKLMDALDDFFGSAPRQRKNGALKF